MFRQLPGNEPDFSACTFCLEKEDHTLGNALRWMIMKELVLLSPRLLVTDDPVVRMSSSAGILRLIRLSTRSTYGYRCTVCRVSHILVQS